MTYQATLFLRYSVRFLAVAFAFTFVVRGFSFAFLPEFVAESVALSKQMTSGYDPAAWGVFLSEPRQRARASWRLVGNRAFEQRLYAGEDHDPKPCAVLG